VHDTWRRIECYLLSFIWWNGTDDSNETNSTEATLMNAIKQGMDELGQGELQQLKDVLLCSPSMEK
jgi:hypothetical protein